MGTYPEFGGKFGALPGCALLNGPGDVTEVKLTQLTVSLDEFPP